MVSSAVRLCCIHNSIIVRVKDLLKLLLVLDCTAATLQMAPPAAVSMIQMMTQQHVMQQQLQRPLN